MNSDLTNWPLLKVYSNATGSQKRHVQELIYLEADLNYTWLHWNDGWRVLVPYSLKRMMAKLPATTFVRIHRHFIVNSAFIDQIELTTDHGLLYTENGACLPISRRRKSTIRRLFRTKLTAASRHHGSLDITRESTFPPYATGQQHAFDSANHTGLGLAFQ